MSQAPDASPGSGQPPPAASGEPGAVLGPAARRAGEQPGGRERNGEKIDALAAAVDRLRARVAESTPPPVAPKPPSHKHSMSLIGRIRRRRKERRER